MRRDFLSLFLYSIFKSHSYPKRNFANTMASLLFLVILG